MNYNLYIDSMEQSRHSFVQQNHLSMNFWQKGVAHCACLPSKALIKREMRGTDCVHKLHSTVNKNYLQHVSLVLFSLVKIKIKNPLLMYSTIRREQHPRPHHKGTRQTDRQLASLTTQQRQAFWQHLYCAGVGFELAIKHMPAQCLDH